MNSATNITTSCRPSCIVCEHKKQRRRVRIIYDAAPPLHGKQLLLMTDDRTREPVVIARVPLRVT